MSPISSSPGWNTRRPDTAGTPAGATPAFSQHLQTVLQQTRPPSIPSAPAGSLHPGGLNDAAQRLLHLGGH